MRHGRFGFSVQTSRFCCSGTFKLLQVALRRDTSVLLMDIAIFSFTTSSSSSPSTRTWLLLPSTGPIEPVSSLQRREKPNGGRRRNRTTSTRRRRTGCSPLAKRAPVQLQLYDIVWECDRCSCFSCFISRVQELEMSLFLQFIVYHINNKS